MDTPPDASLIRDQLERLLIDVRFTRAPILSRLLRYIVEETLAGRGDGLKEYVLGVEVCGRPPAYDPRTDPIVRVQTRELRRRLADYYASEGRFDPIVIEVPKGRYVATFSTRASEPPPEVSPPQEDASQGVAPPALAAPAATPLYPSLRPRVAWAAAGTLLLAALTWGVWGSVSPFVNSGTAAPLPPSIAVLPFQNLGADPDDNYLSEGMTEEVISAAAHVEGLRVLGRTSVFRFNRDSQDELEMARQLKVDAIVAGSVRSDGDRVRIAARLVRAADGALLWSDTFDGNRAELFDVQERIAQAVSRALAVRLGAGGRLETSTRDPEARTLYLKGRYFWNKRSGDGVLKAIDFFEQAVARDPRYAQAFAGLAEAHIMSIWYVFTPPVVAVPRGKAAALRAVELQPRLAEAQAALGSAQMMEWDWTGATQSLEKAIALDPDYPRAHHLYAYTMLLLDRPERAVVAMRQAQQLDPLSLVTNGDLAEILDFAGHTDEAIEQARKTIEMDPSFAIAHYSLERALRRKRLDREALEERLRGDSLIALPARDVTDLRAAAAAGGWRAYWSKRAEQLTSAPEGSITQYYEIGRAYAYLGRLDEAFTWFTRAFDRGDAKLVNLGVDCPEDIRSDPRLVALQRKMGLPDHGLRVFSTH